MKAIRAQKIKSLVEGELLQIHFKEGQEVTQGERLFTLDPRSLNESVAQAQGLVSKDRAQIHQAQSTRAKDLTQVHLAQANLKRDEALLAYAKAQELRYLSLLEKEFISREQYEQVLSNKKSLEETVKADEASVENAKALLLYDEATVENAKAQTQSDQAALMNSKIKLNYATIKAPLSGKTGNLLANTGDLIKANDTEMITIEQLTPIYVSFTVPEKELDAIRHYQAAKTLKVFISPSESSAEASTLNSKPIEGKLTFIDNTVDPTTGMVQLKAEFANTEKTLWPGQFVNVHLTLTEIKNAIVVPSQSVQIGQDGTFVYVVQSDVKETKSIKQPERTVELRPVTVKQTYNNLTIISKGLKPGEIVVTDGLLKLSPNAHVVFKKMH
ncbi:MAG: efflux RND transporter periplasmic adaptor subunit [Cyanobacteria bacterium]|nr:efflux RND transporter periplasmic adaptor subunit [Cyanobacteriota bacterium]